MLGTEREWIPDPPPKLSGNKPPPAWLQILLLPAAIPRQWPMGGQSPGTVSAMGGMVDTAAVIVLGEDQNASPEPGIQDGGTAGRI